MNKQQTAVEWLEEICNDRGYHLMKEYFEQAKQLEKQQIIDAYETGIWDAGCRAADSEQYYQETFKK